MELDGHRLATEVDEEQVADVKMMLKQLSEAGAVSAPVVAPVATAPTPQLAEHIVKESLETPTPDGMSCFNIVMPDITEKDVENLQEELGLLGDATVSKQADGRFVISLTTDSSQDDIVSICSFIVDPDDLVITLKSDSPVVGTSPAQEATSELAIAVETQVDTSNKVLVQEEVGYGLFEEEGKEKQEEGYGFFAPFQPHPDAVKSNLIGDDTALTLANSGTTSAQLATAVKAEVAATTASQDADRRNAGRREADKAPASAEASSIRVGVEKVDQLINLVGELVITQAMIEQRISMLDPVHNEALINSVGQLTRNTRDLQESVMSIRMMPMDFVFSRFPRMVRDLAAKLNKKVDFVTVGATTELDKGLIERIVDPLTHLVRNSVDHGIEIPENRRKAGKSESGTLTLSAAHKGGSIVIEVTDDGAGLNRDRILAKAQSNGLPVSENMTDGEVFSLIFAPGFSTAEVVTDVSGRGVGMDVVKRNITAMGGSVEIRSALGFGTTISIALPLTLAILDGMSVSLGDSVYVIPLNLIVETLQPRAEDIKTVTGEGRMVHVRGEYLPIIALHSLFNHKTDITDPTQGVLVLLESDGKKSALFVDRLVGQQQVVIKSLETNFKKIPGVSGATIMGDGSVALILDVAALIQIGQTTNYITGAASFSNQNNQHMQSNA
jgi:two-component system chemotaxis sensor kinase CheA